MEIKKRLLFLFAVYIVFLCITVSFANDFNDIFGLILPGGIYVFPLTFIICDIVSEVYGYSVARTFIWLGIFSEFTFALISEFIILMPHPDFFTHGPDYETVFSPTMRYVLSGMVGFIVGEFLNIYLIAKWKIKLKGKLFIIRSVCTTALGQALLSIIVDTLAFGGKMSTPNLLWMMFSGWSIKMLYSFVFVVPAWIIVRYLKRKEGIDYYDTKTNFNPFKI